jgi:hypothetical protein
MLVLLAKRRRLVPKGPRAAQAVLGFAVVWRTWRCITKKYASKFIFSLLKIWANTLIWEFCSDEEGVEDQDEATVRPSEDKAVVGYAPGVYIVAADVTYGDGSRGLGYLYSGEPDDFGCVQPNVVVGTEQVNFWLGSLSFTPNWETLVAAALKLLGGTSDSLFPMSFETRAFVNGAPLEVVLDGFMARDDERRIVKVA